MWRKGKILNPFPTKSPATCLRGRPGLSLQGKAEAGVSQGILFLPPGEPGIPLPHLRQAVHVAN